MKRNILLLSCIILSGLSYGQSSKLANTLLWRISGNGLSRPSYLYGTMHLTDKRIFQLGDSLYNGIEQTEGFAGELDMNSMGMQMVNYLVADKEAKKAREAVKVKDAVNLSVWERYKDQLEKKFYKPADQITVDDLEELGSLLENELMKKGDMPTFLDAYLFGVARKQGKWVGGLEDLRDQIEHLNSEKIEQKIQKALFDDHYYRSEMEMMIRIYTAQNLDTLDQLMYRKEDGEKDYIMIKRNLKMARMMDSLSSVRSSFFAVGAAHLPGDSGVIALLKNRGYTISPVFSSKKISPDKYVVKTKEMPWVPANIKDSVYAIAMPGASENVAMLESMGLNLKMFFDISFMKMYMTLGVEVSEERKKLGADSLYKVMRTRFFEKSKDVKEKRVTVNGIEGREYDGNTSEGNMKVQVFIPAMEEIVMNAVLTLTKNASDDDDETDKFFQSFNYNGVPKKTASTANEWTTVSNPGQLFSIDWPLKPRETKDVNSQEGKIIYSYQAVDVKNQVFLGASITSVKEGRYQAGADSSFFASFKERLKTQMEDVKMIDSSYVSVGIYPGHIATVSAKAQGETIEVKALSFARGNRSYYLFAVYSPLGENRLLVNRFLQSIKLLTPSDNNWKMITSPDSSFAVYSNVQVKKAQPKDDDFHRDAERFILFDSVLASSTYIDKTVLPDWLWFSSDTAFLRHRTSQYKGYNDSLADYIVAVKDGRVIADFTVTSPETRLVKKVKLVLDGNELYEMFGHFDPLDYTGSVKKTFDDFRLLTPAARVDRSSARMDNLVKTLEAGKIEELKRLNEWWTTLKFSGSDVPTLQKFLLKPYPDLDSTTLTGVNKLLFDKVSELDTLNTTVAYIKDNYKKRGEDIEPLMPFIVYYLAGVHTGESYSLIKSILLEQPVRATTSLFALHNLSDSLELAATLFPDILKYGDVDANGFYIEIQDLTIRLLDEGLIAKKMIRDKGTPFINWAKKHLDSDKESIEEDPYKYFDIIKLMGIINSPESNAMLTRFAKISNRAIRFRTLVAQLANNQPVDSRTIYTMASTDEYRFDLYQELKKRGKLNLFPSSFLSQHDLGKSKIYADASTRTSPATISFVAERTIEYKGKRQKLLLYKVEPGDFTSGPYLGVSGPYSLNTNDYNTTNEVTGVFRKKNFDANKLDSLFRDYLSSLDEKADDIAEPPPPPVSPIRRQ